MARLLASLRVLAGVALQMLDRYDVYIRRSLHRHRLDGRTCEEMKYWCPLILSNDLAASDPFRLNEDKWN